MIWDNRTRRDAVEKAVRWETELWNSGNGGGDVDVGGGWGEGGTQVD